MGELRIPLKKGSEMGELKAALKKSAELREEFIMDPVAVVSRYGVQLTNRQLELLAQAREFEADPLLSETMCPKSSGYEEIAPRKRANRKSTR
jgi:hypothetical protein